MNKSFKLTQPGGISGDGYATLPPQIPNPDLVRVKLMDDLYACHGARGELYHGYAGQQEDVESMHVEFPKSYPGIVASGQILYVFDSLGIVNSELLARYDSNDQLYIPKGTYAWVWWKSDTAQYEPVEFGTGCTVEYGGSDESAQSGSNPSGCVTTAKIISGKTTTTVASTDASFTLDQLHALDCGKICEDTLSVDNWCHINADAGTEVWAIYDCQNTPSPNWRFLQAPCTT